jgi:hypothetical protein
MCRSSGVLASSGSPRSPNFAVRNYTKQGTCFSGGGGKLHKGTQLVQKEFCTLAANFHTKKQLNFAWELPSPASSLGRPFASVQTLRLIWTLY